MKKLLMGIFGLTLLLPLGVLAETTLDSVETGSNSTNQSITVGTVEVPVYEVNISWDSTSFDWVYNEEKGIYNWKVTGVCTGTIPGEAEELLNEGAKVYSDNTCSTEITLEEYEDNTGYFYVQPRGASYITIVDGSVNGRVVPSVLWTPTTDYQYVDVEFSYQTLLCVVMDDEEYIASQYGSYSDSECKNTLENPEENYEPGKYYTHIRGYKQLTSREIPSDGQIDSNAYYLKLNLKNKEKPTTTPKAGDTIGTITISIRAAE